MFRVMRDYVFDGVARLLGLPLPEAGDEAASKDYVDGVLAGASNFKDPVQARVAVNIDLSAPGATLDNRTMLVGDRVLVAKQTATAENGIYDWNGAAVPLTRSSDCDAAAELNAALVTVDGEDSDYFALTYRQTLIITTLDTDPVKWVFFGKNPPQATETEKGVAELATQAESDALTDDLRIVTPLKMGVTVTALIDTALDDFAAGAGTVVSVNGMSGTVVLDADDVGAVPAPASPVAGDLLSYQSGAWERLPVGTDGQALVVTAGAPAWGTPSAGHDPVTIGTANGLSLATQVLSLQAATASVPGAMTAAYAAKLDGIAAGAQVNPTNTDTLPEGAANLYFTDERVDDRVASLLTAGSGVTLTYDDTANTLTIDATSTGGGATRYTKSAQWQMTDGSAIVVTTPTTSGVQTLQDAGAIVRWTITGEGGPGSCEVGVYISTFVAGPPDSGDSVTGGNNPEIVAGHQSDDATLTGWTTAVTAGSQISMVLLSSSSFTKLTICLEIQRT